MSGERPAKYRQEIQQVSRTSTTKCRPRIPTKDTSGAMESGCLQAIRLSRNGQLSGPNKTRMDVNRQRSKGPYESKRHRTEKTSRTQSTSFYTKWSSFRTNMRLRGPPTKPQSSATHDCQTLTMKDSGQTRYFIRYMSPVIPNLLTTGNAQHLRPI